MSIHIVHIDKELMHVVTASENSTDGDTIFVVGGRFIVGGDYGDFSVTLACEHGTTYPLPESCDEMIASVHKIICETAAGIERDPERTYGMFVVDTHTFSAKYAHFGTLEDIATSPHVTNIATDYYIAAIGMNGQVVQFILSRRFSRDVSKGDTVVLSPDILARSIEGWDVFRMFGRTIGSVVIFDAHVHDARRWQIRKIADIQPRTYYGPLLTRPKPIVIDNEMSIRTAARIMTCVYPLILSPNAPKPKYSDEMIRVANQRIRDMGCQGLLHLGSLSGKDILVNDLTLPFSINDEHLERILAGTNDPSTIHQERRDILVDIIRARSMDF